MRDQGASAESFAISPGSRFPLPGADTFAQAWSEPPDEILIPDHPEKATAISAAMLALGAALLLLVPIVGAVLIVSGGTGLAITWEGPLAGRAAPPITASSVTAGQPSPASSTDH